MNIKKKQFIFLFLSILILGIFFYFYNYLNIHNSSQPLIFNSPDETANYYFTKLFTQSNRLQKNNNLLNFSADIHPRSINGIEGKLVPNSFIGIFLIYGIIAKIFGIWIIIYLTPLIAILGVLFFYLLIKEIFDKKTALISAILLLILPSYWYFSTRTMMHNVLFIDLVITSIYFFIISLKKNKIIYYLSSVFFLALALLVRSSEIVWLTIIFISFFLVFRKKIKLFKIILSSILLIFALLTIFYFNSQNYGSSISVAYLGNLNHQKLNTFYYLKKIFLPFGFHPRNIKFTIWNFIFKLIWWHSIALLLSLIFIFFQRKKLKKQQWFYIFLWFFISLFLFIYYGSWLFFDNPDPTAITIGSSYLRYLLPYFVFSIPLISWSLSKIKFKNKILNNVLIATLIGFMFFNSYLLVMRNNQEGILKISQDLKKYQISTKLIMKNTEKNSIIITSRADKYIFPYRQVIYFQKETYDYQNLKNIIKNRIPLYYFGFKFKKNNLKYARDKFNKKGIKLSNPIFINKDHALYKLTLNNE